MSLVKLQEFQSKIDYTESPVTATEPISFFDESEQENQCGVSFRAADSNSEYEPAMKTWKKLHTLSCTENQRWENQMCNANKCCGFQKKTQMRQGCLFLENHKRRAFVFRNTINVLLRLRLFLENTINSLLKSQESSVLFFENTIDVLFRIRNSTLIVFY
jgi:hypothetical protein